MVKRSLFPLKLDKWDSGFFKKPIVRLHISGKKKYHDFYGKIKTFLRNAKKSGIACVVIRLEHPKPSYEKALARSGMKQCGESLNLVHRYSSPFAVPRVEGYKIRPYRKSDCIRICNIAKDAFRLSYLYKCGFAGREKVDLYHKIWLKNQTGNKNYIIFVTERRGQIAGFVTINLNNTKNSARMSLMAVDKRHRGKGLGAFMIRSMLKEAVRRKKDTHFRTQSDNKIALSIYWDLGCRQLSKEKIYSKKI